MWKFMPKWLQLLMLVMIQGGHLPMVLMITLPADAVVEEIVDYSITSKSNQKKMSLMFSIIGIYLYRLI